ncbi:hypothetical protein BDV93DRAFT_557520 [Ceratobasidium sp. AG-I]|nr:hypothetical protein BDV93DRAFT_557520 [Ceratobasidium sp. AG-I]
MSKADVPLLADVVVQYDALNEQYGKICHDQKQPLYLRRVADHTQGVLNRYYEKTDKLLLYQLALLLHPSMRVHYLKAAGCHLDWIKTVVEIAETCWHTHYKPAHFNEAMPATESSGTAPSFAFSSYMDRVLSKLNNEETVLVSPIDAFVNAKPIFNIIGGGRAVFNPLAWWYGQRAVGNEENGLTRMALDMLSTPASSVNVKQAFLFAGSIVSKCRHNLSPGTIQATASLGLYSKAGRVKPGTLVLPLCGKEKEKPPAT